MGLLHVIQVVNSSQETIIIIYTHGKMILRKTKSEKEVEIDFLRRLQFLIM